MVGESPYSTSETYTLSGGIIAGRNYKFRYRALNIFGWGEFSEQGTVLAAAEPARIEPVEVTRIGTEVKIAFILGETNGAIVTQYLVEIETSETGVFVED